MHFHFLKTNTRDLIVNSAIYISSPREKCPLDLLDLVACAIAQCPCICMPCPIKIKIKG
jgi:hypothetical protein